jgi:hypothetical protein
MREKLVLPERQEDTVSSETADIDIQFATLLYRYLFFDWLFADMTKTRDLLERHSAWQHNRSMRIHLPVYLRRWSALTALAFGLGCLFEHMLKAGVMAACFFTSSCVALTITLVTSVLWAFLYKPEMS